MSEQDLEQIKTGLHIITNGCNKAVDAVLEIMKGAAIVLTVWEKNNHGSIQSEETQKTLPHHS